MNGFKAGPRNHPNALFRAFLVSEFPRVPSQEVPLAYSDVVALFPFRLGVHLNPRDVLRQFSLGPLNVGIQQLADVAEPFRNELADLGDVRGDGIRL